MANKTPGHPSSFTLFNLTTAYSISTRPSQDGTSRDGSPKKDVEVPRRPNWDWWQDLESPEKVVFASPITYNLRKFVRKNFLKKILIEEFYSFFMFVYLFTYSWRSCIWSIDCTRSVHSAPNSAAENRTRAAPTVEQRYSWTRKYLLHRSRNSLTLNLLSVVVGTEFTDKLFKSLKSCI